MSTPKLYYWGIKARAHLAVLVAAYTGNALEWEKKPDWPAMKGETPFGQLPYLVDGDVKLAQSMAIARYLAQKFGLTAPSLADFANSEQLIEESTDVYNLIVKANYSPAGKAEGYKEFFASLPKHFTALEKLLKDRPVFNSKILLGDLAVFAVIDIIVDLNPAVLAEHPKLAAFYQHVKEIPAVAAAVTGVPAYFCMP